MNVGTCGKFVRGVRVICSGDGRCDGGGQENRKDVIKQLTS
jgi:hypothetical protein